MGTQKTNKNWEKMQPLRLINNRIFCVVILSIAINMNIDASESFALNRYIQYSFSLQNTGNMLLPDSEFWMYAPVHNASQEILSIKANYQYQLTSDRLGNQILHFSFHNIPPFGTKIITIQAQLLIYQSPQSTISDNLEIFLKHEKYVESNSQEIINLAKKLQASENIKTTKNIFKWVSTNLTYTGYIMNDRGALWALNNQKGDCTEYMYLFVALCRANGIPARGIGGYVYNKDSVLHPSDYHNWAEFYLDGAWNIADPQKDIFMDNYSHYISMRIISESPENPMGNYHRFRFSGDGLKIYMN